MIKTKYNKKNTVTKYSIVVLLFSIAFLLVRFNTEPKNIYNFVDLQMKYKNYILVEKYRSIFNDEVYIFKLRNPINNIESNVYVKYYLYHNVYFVGDTIK